MQDIAGCRIIVPTLMRTSIDYLRNGRGTTGGWHVLSACAQGRHR
jgi:hypothetical protein